MALKPVNWWLKQSGISKIRKCFHGLTPHKQHYILFPGHRPDALDIGVHVKLLHQRSDLFELEWIEANQDEHLHAFAFLAWVDDRYLTFNRPDVSQALKSMQASCSRGPDCL